MVYKDFDNKRNIDFSYDVDVIKNHIDRLLKTPVGSLLDYPDYGSHITEFIYEPLNENTRFALYSEIMAAIDRFEKRVKIIKLDVSQNLDEFSFTISYEAYVAELAATITSAVVFK